MGNAIFGAKLVLPLKLISPSSPAWCSTIKFSYCCPCCCHKNMKILLETAQKSRCTCSRELQLRCKPGTTLQPAVSPAQSGPHCSDRCTGLQLELQSTTATLTHAAATHCRNAAAENQFQSPARTQPGRCVTRARARVEARPPEPGHPGDDGDQGCVHCRGLGGKS